MEKIIVYEFKYNECIYESSPFTLSIHRTREGAEKALEEHKNSIKKEYAEFYDNSEYLFDYGKSWTIVETEVLD